MSIAPPRDRSPLPTPAPIEVLIEEARRRGRRHLAIGLLAFTLAAGLAVALIGGFGFDGSVGHGSSPKLPPIRGAVPVDLSRGLASSMNWGQLVSCPGDTCVVVGIAAGHKNADLVARLYRNGEWSNLPAPRGFASYQLNGLSCISSATCVLTGYYNTASAKGWTRAFAEVLHGSSWLRTVVPVPPGAISSALTAVSCSSSSSCIAMGTSFTRGTRWNGRGNGVFSEVWNGSHWRLVSMPWPANAWGGGEAQFSGVSCPTMNWCMAVGWYSTHAATVSLVEAWSDGQWTLIAAPQLVGAKASEATQSTRLMLAGVSCVSSTMCAASGTDGLAGALEPVQRAELAVWNGRSWMTIVGSSWRLVSGGPHSASWRPNPGVGPVEPNFGSVSCSSAARCVTYITSEGLFGLPRAMPMSFFERDARGWYLATTRQGKYQRSASDVSCMVSGVCLVVGTNHGSGGNADGAFAYGVGPRSTA
jgi:hypothetical protein